MTGGCKKKQKEDYRSANLTTSVDVGVVARETVFALKSGGRNVRQNGIVRARFSRSYVPFTATAAVVRSTASAVTAQRYHHHSCHTTEHNQSILYTFHI